MLFRPQKLTLAVLKALPRVLVRLWLLPRPGFIAGVRYITSFPTSEVNPSCSKSSSPAACEALPRVLVRLWSLPIPGSIASAHYIGVFLLKKCPLCCFSSRRLHGTSELHECLERGGSAILCSTITHCTVCATTTTSSQYRTLHVTSKYAPSRHATFFAPSCTAWSRRSNGGAYGTRSIWRRSLLR